MPARGEPCARKQGHLGDHRDAAFLERDRENFRRRVADPEYRAKRQAAYRVENLTPAQREERRRRDARFTASVARWIAWRKYDLKNERERILEQLDALHREEEQWLTRSDTTTQTR